MTTSTATIAAGRGRALRLTAVMILAGLSLAACATAPPPVAQEFAASRVPAQLNRAPPPATQPVKPAAPVAARPRDPDPAVVEARGFPRGGRYKIGSPYKVSGIWYKPADQPDYDRVGIASWYGDDFHGHATANGERFNMYTASAAHTTLPLPSIVEVTNLGNGRSIRVRLNDRGPFAGGRIIDLSRNAAEELGYKDKGLARVRVRYIGPARLDGTTVPLYVARSRRDDDATFKLASAAATPRAVAPLVRAADRVPAASRAVDRTVTPEYPRGRLTMASYSTLQRALYPSADQPKLAPLY